MFSSLNVTPAELWQMLLTHLWLSGLALLAAVAIAVPAAVLFARRQRAAEAVLQFTNILQTIPSLALLGLLIPFVGIGSPRLDCAHAIRTVANFSKYLFGADSNRPIDSRCVHRIRAIALAVIMAD